MAEQRKAVIKNADMSEAMQQDAVDVASVALSKYNIEKVCPSHSESNANCILISQLHFLVSRMLRLTSKKNLTKSTTQHGKETQILIHKASKETFPSNLNVSLS